ncbi:MAG: cobyric acid synthase [Selenomonadaceae bacterium]|nr:cobyric acid synthase [Selenomonadaceae bacterium]MBP3722192.1 cobyric acid synthase [Selenomonadaceae bacterium]
MTKYIMMMGTSSHVGKSILAAAFCRIFFQDGKKVAPFKAQNMALNSYVTKLGDEMGRAQVMQAEAAKIDPDANMNPVLLKPTGNSSSQVIIMGKPIGTYSAKDYHEKIAKEAWEKVKTAIKNLSDEYDTIVIEGAGSPAEVNLKANDIVNMKVAKYLNAPVILIADIDRGGALASLVGTLELLDDKERDLVKGLVINKFRGDITLLKPAIDFLEEKTKKPVLGVLPYIYKLQIDDEDSVSLNDKKDNINAKITIAIIRLPKISNFTDFDALTDEEDVNIIYAENPKEIDDADLIILPGSKNTISDLLYIRQNGIEKKIREKLKNKTPVIAVCGGYQMIGKTIKDPYNVESDLGKIEGLSLIDMNTIFNKEKHTSQVALKSNNISFLNINKSYKNLTGYEIHMGETVWNEKVNHPFMIISRNGENINEYEGISSPLILGTYIHGMFDNDEFRTDLLNALRMKKGLSQVACVKSRKKIKEENYNLLADIVRKNLDMEKIKEFIGD